MKRNKKNCKNCGESRYIFGHGLCERCYRINLSKKKGKPKAHKPPTGELELFKKIYESCGGVSVIDGVKLNSPEHPMFHWQFAHVLPKGAYGRFRLDERNILPMTAVQHTQFDNFRHDIREEPEWAWVFKLEEKLKIEYNDKGGN